MNWTCFFSLDPYFHASPAQVLELTQLIFQRTSVSLTHFSFFFCLTMHAGAGSIKSHCARIKKQSNVTQLVSLNHAQLERDKQKAGETRKTCSSWSVLFGGGVQLWICLLFLNCIALWGVFLFLRKTQIIVWNGQLGERAKAGSLPQLHICIFAWAEGVCLCEREKKQGVDSDYRAARARIVRWRMHITYTRCKKKKNGEIGRASCRERVL